MWVNNHHSSVCGDGGRSLPKLSRSPETGPHTAPAPGNRRAQQPGNDPAPRCRRRRVPVPSVSAPGPRPGRAPACTPLLRQAEIMFDNNTGVSTPLTGATGKTAVQPGIRGAAGPQDKTGSNSFRTFISQGLMATSGHPHRLLCRWFARRTTVFRPLSRGGSRDEERTQS